MSIDPEKLLDLAKDRHGPAGVTLGWPMVVKIVDELRRLRALVEDCRQEARFHAQEARTQRTTVQEIYKEVSGGQGEPGDWHGAEPVRELVAERDALASLAAERAQFILNAVDMGYCRLPDEDTPDSARGTYEKCKLTDSEVIARRDARMRMEGAMGVRDHLRAKAKRLWASDRVPCAFFEQSANAADTKVQEYRHQAEETAE